MLSKGIVLPPRICQLFLLSSCTSYTSFPYSRGIVIDSLIEFCKDSLSKPFTGLYDLGFFSKVIHRNSYVSIILFIAIEVCVYDKNIIRQHQSSFDSIRRSVKNHKHHIRWELCLYISPYNHDFIRWNLHVIRAVKVITGSVFCASYRELDTFRSNLTLSNLISSINLLPFIS